ncbi:MAG: 23S rRNA (adenine(2503)-C(2))-methyltransferase RlmN [Bacillota bacterium]|jgi:23S rRNA (adenine2503-C2)-methyltransferase
MEDDKPNFLDLDLQSFSDLLSLQGEKPYRARQVWAWTFKRFAASFDEMTDLPQSLRQYLEAFTNYRRLHLLRAQEGEAGWSKKYLWGQNGTPVCESVVLKYSYGLTACLSTQVGCPVGCAFCASSQLGFGRNLRRGEILEELLGMCRDQGQRIGRIVFMGTGEPFLNYREVLGAIETLSDPRGYGLSRRRVTVSTVGIPDAIRRFAKDSRGARLAVSLHAASNDVRDRIMPYNKRFPIEQVVSALKDYALTTGQRVTIEYMLLGGINDSPSEADRLASLVSGMDLLVNLILWNEVPGLPFRRSEPRKVLEFRRRLERNRVKVTVRRSLGGGISAACGQLGLGEEER